MKPMEIVREASKYASILDVGCGTGKYLRRFTAPKVIGIETHVPTINHAKAMCPNAEVWRIDMRDLRVFEDNMVECITAMDVIEHAIKEEAEAVLKNFERVASKCILLFVPTGAHPQTGDATNLGNVYWQVHRSEWQPEDFEKLGYEIWRYPDFHGRSKGAVSCRKLLQK